MREKNNATLSSAFPKTQSQANTVFEIILFYLLSSILFISLGPIKVHFPWTTQILIALIALFVFSEILSSNRNLSQITNGYVLVLMLSFGLILIYTLIGYEQRQGVYIYKFTRALPLFFAGMCIARNHKLRSHLFLVFIASPIVSNMSTIGSVQGSSLVIRDDVEGDLALYSLYSPYLLIAPAISSILSLFHIFKVNSNKSYEKYIMYFLFFWNALIVLRSGFANPLIMLIAGVFIVLLLKLPRIEWYKTYIAAGGAVVFSVSIYILLTKFAPDAPATFKITNIVNMLLWGAETDMNFVSGGRFDLMEASWNTFLSNMLFGVGSHQGTGTYHVIGSHSSVIDNFGEFGLIGGVLLNGILISWIYASVKIYRSYIYKDLGIVLIGVWCVYFLGCILNPYFLSESIDHYIFTLAGLTVGYAVEIKTLPSHSGMKSRFIGRRPE